MDIRSNEGKPTRLGIYFFYDQDGVVDDYVVHFLEDMRKSLTDLVIISNGDLSEEAIAKLLPLTDQIFVRENRGFDVWAYKYAMESIGWGKLETYDEVILMNSTIMGPVYPFSEMFEEMDQRDVDFWGITAYHAEAYDPFGMLPDNRIPWHIQSHFMAFRRSMVSSPEFQDYWRNVPMINTYTEAVALHEAVFTEKFESLGFKAGVYVDTSDLEEFTAYPLNFAPRELIENRKCPIFKRRSFFADYNYMLSESVGTATRELYEYLRDRTDYDLDLVWQNALRTMNLADLVRALHLNYVLPTHAKQPGTDKAPRRLALVAHVYYVDLYEEMLPYISSMPEGTSLILTTNSEEKVDELERLSAELPYDVDVRLIPNRGRDVSALLVGARDVLDRFDLVCFIHDKRVAQLQPLTKGAGFAEKCFENLLATPDFVSNVIALFGREKHLGMLMPSPPNHSDYFPTHIQSWGPNFDNTVEVLRRVGVEVPLSSDKPPISPLGTMFWFRPEAMRPLLGKEWVYEDFPAEPNDVDGTLLHAIERAYSYVGQSLGYYSAWLYSDRFAAVELTNLQFQVTEMLKAAMYTVSTSGLPGIVSQLEQGPTRAEFVEREHRIVKLERELYAARLDASPKHRAKQVIKKVVPESLHSNVRSAVNQLKGIE